MASTTLAGKVENEREGDGEEDKGLADNLRKAGAELLKDGSGVRIAGWTISTRKGSILKMDQVERLEKNLQTTHLPEMVFGDNVLELRHEATGLKIHFNPFDALRAWKSEGLPPVEVPAAAQWKFSRRPNQEVVLDYDYTFTTPYSGSEAVESKTTPQGLSKGEEEAFSKIGVSSEVAWIECDERIDLQALQARDPILFYDEVVLYEDELADNGISILTVKVRVMPKCWFLLLRYWLRVDGVMMRLRDTRMFSAFDSDSKQAPLVLRERCQKEDSFQALVSRGLPTDMAAYAEPNTVQDSLRTKAHFSEKLVFTDKVETPHSGLE